MCVCVEHNAAQLFAWTKNNRKGIFVRFEWEPLMYDHCSVSVMRWNSIWRLRLFRDDGDFSTAYRDVIGCSTIKCMRICAWSDGR